MWVDFTFEFFADDKALKRAAAEGKQFFANHWGCFILTMSSRFYHIGGEKTWQIAEGESSRLSKYSTQ